MAMWTKAQETAIYKPSGEGSILVSAAAGSGKTAVLVERIAELVTREENPVSIDELLVVTFTEAAAAEMKERITARLVKEQRSAADAGKGAKARYLKEQIHLTAAADINTIDSFCLGVVKNNFHILGVDPNFGIMDDSETDMLMDDAFDELFTGLYTVRDERFDYLVKIYASNRDDEDLKSIIRKIYKFVQSFAEPHKWLSEKADMYSEDMTESKWVKGVFLEEQKEEILKRHEEFWIRHADEMLEKAGVDDCGSYETCAEAAEYWGKKLWKSVCACREAVIALKRAESFEDIFTFYKTYIASKRSLGAAINTIQKDKIASEEEWRYYYDAYDYMRDDLRKVCSCLPAEGREEFNSYVHAGEIKKTVDCLVWLTELFDAKYEEKKARRNIKSFSDIEHLAYRLFADNENIRDEYTERYTEILIDEYQDTNGLQDAIFAAISRNKSNIFMVGDLKQSIYKFRGGDPMIFKEKNRLFTRGEGGSKIMLSQNFRSRREVLAGINAVFDKMMSDSVGDVVYDDDEALKRDAEREYYPDGEDYRSELYNIAVLENGGETDEDVTADRAEAACIADRIQRLVSEDFKVYDGGMTRPVSYRDIVILMRSVRSGDAVREALEKRNIPVFIQKEEYFERREIKLMLSLVSLINNHLQDIPLTAVMRSPIGGFTDNELAMIKIKSRGGAFYHAVKSYRADGDKREIEFEKKCRDFTKSLERWRGYVKMKSIASLIWTLYEETHIYDFMGALEGGEEAQANLKLLYERAKRYEASGFKGIFNFIRYIERMENRSDDISGAKLVNESHNVVRVMTIHKSKGLEFPIVFLARTARKFSGGAYGENRVQLHAKYGIGVDYYNYEDMYRKKLMFNRFIKEKNDREGRSEEMRLMYVAMTRAKEKLIVTSAKKFKDEDDYITKTNAIRKRHSGMTGMMQASEEAKSYSDWITAAVGCTDENWIRNDMIVSSVDYDAEKKEAEETEIREPEKIRALVAEILGFSYAYPRSGYAPAKTSVTAIKEMADEEHIHEDDPVYMFRRPAFMRGEGMGARIGTAHHQVMAFINIDAMRSAGEEEYEELVKRETERIISEGQIDKEIAEDEEIVAAICENVCGFFRSGMGKRVLSARRVCRETPFEIAIPVSEYDGSAEDIAGEEIVVQGIIDIYFEDENGDIILVDYKTDSCKTEEQQLNVARRYAKQLELYERAMEKILKRNVKEKFLYLFSAQNVVQLN